MCREAARGLALLCLWSCLACASSTRAEALVLSLSALYESPDLAVPVVALAYAGEKVSFRLAQAGWTSSAESLVPLEPKLGWLLDAALTPRFANFSNRVYRAGKEDPSLAYRATAVQATTGVRVEHSEHAQSALRMGVHKQWITQLSPDQEAMWRRPYALVQLTSSLTFVRSDDLYRARWDGLKASLDVQGLYGSSPFFRGRITLGLGRKFGPLFAQIQGAGTYVSTDNLAARALVGGSLDAIGAQALHGHPYAEFRAQQSSTGTARLDLALGRLFELGLRASAGQTDGAFHHGAGVMLSVLFSGILIFVGAATPDAELSRTLVFAGASAATFL